MGTIASRPALSASFAEASVFCHVGMLISGTRLMLGMVLVQKVPSFSLLSLKMGLVVFFTRAILPEILRITMTRQESLESDKYDFGSGGDAHRRPPSACTVGCVDLHIS